MDKIEEILNDHCGAIRFIFHNDEGNMRDEYDIICAMKEFGKICFEAGRENKTKYNPTKDGKLYQISIIPEFRTYEEFLNEIENEADDND
jgi:hypothetical protein